MYSSTSLRIYTSGKFGENLDLVAHFGKDHQITNHVPDTQYMEGGYNFVMVLKIIPNHTLHTQEQYDKWMDQQKHPLIVSLLLV